MASVLLETTPRCQKAFVGFLAAFAPRLQNTRGQGQACLKGDASQSHRPFLCQFNCLLLADDPWVGLSALENGHLWVVSAEYTLVAGTVSTVVDFGRSGLVHSVAVLFQIRPCLCFGNDLCHFVVVFLPILARTFCLAIPSRCLLRCHFESCSVAFNFPLFSCFVLAALTTRLTLVMATAGLLKTSTPGCCWISTRSSCTS